MLISHNKPTIDDEEINAITMALRNLELTKGTKVDEFEDAFSKYIGRNAVATSSGTSALHLALIALDISKNDEVLVPSYTCTAVAFPVLYQDAKPILVDVNDDYNISVTDVKRKITKKTKAIIVPHMFGYPANLDEINELCEKNNIYLIEDCAQSMGAMYSNKKVGAIGDISIFSFYATKIMTSIQGGMVCTDNSDWIQIIKDLRYHDQCRSCEDNDLRIKYSYMMSDIEATVGIVQLKKFDYFVERRKEIANIYRNKLVSDFIQHPFESNEKDHVYSRYVIRTSYSPDILRGKLRQYGIICERMHSPPLHKRALFKRFNDGLEFKKTDEIVDSAISLPIYPDLTDGEVEYIIESFYDVTER
ncbi:DegT/DnrJ/EryC1/StrS family aminotransferase [Candidatus Pacearchaeota archaeon]|nr:DegT/DnrJ/EryC1/StrS family aminotransferase [Candidatus Pacearchaeota archaeon]